jgi:hypothetical protein
MAPMPRPLTDAQLLDLVALLPAERPFTSEEADSRGVVNHHRRHLVSRGLLQRPVRGVFHLAALPDTLQLRVEVLRLLVPSDCVVTDRTAAWLWGAPTVLAPGDHLAVPHISVFAPPGRRLRNGLVASGERRLLGCDVATVHDVRMTTPLRTACDLGRLLHRDQALGSMDMLAGLRRFSVDELVEELTRFRGYRGIVQARLLAPLVDARSESLWESVLRLRWYDAGLPRPECQVEIEAPYGSYFLDIGLPDLRFGAEYDGEEAHGPEREQHDTERRAWARQYGGWSLVVARSHNVIGRHQDIERTLRRQFALHQSLAA